MFKIECSKCFGKGKINGFQHVLNGECFRCHGKGFVIRKAKTRPKKLFKTAFLWIDKNDVNYNNGDFLWVWGPKPYPSENKAKQKAAEAMAENGSIAFKVERVA